MAKPRAPRDVAILTGFDAEGRTVFEQRLGLHEYWDDSHPVIDEEEFRRRLGIVRLVGKLFGGTGNLIQEFENGYDVRGELVSGTARHEDGTTTRFGERQ